MNPTDDPCAYFPEPAPWRPNQWDVTLEATEDQVAAWLDEWSWGDDTDPVSVAGLMMGEIRDSTMACLDDGPDRIRMGLFEYEMTLTVCLSDLVQGWIEGRTSLDGKLSEAHRYEALGWAERLEWMAARFRRSLGEVA